MAPHRQKGANMSVNTASDSEGKFESQQATATVGPTGYRVSICQGALEVSARLANPAELHFLIKILQANAAIMSNATKKDAA